MSSLSNFYKLSKNNNKKIFSLLRKEGYKLQDKISVNHIFKKSK